jgi:mono/diheme cytochrome c family protein
LLALLLAGCDDLPGRPILADRPVPPQDEMRFEPLFARRCAGCHGREGKLGPAPPLNDPIFLAIVPEDELVRIIQDGRHGTLMPGFGKPVGGPLSDEQASALAVGLKTHWKKADAGDMSEVKYLPYVGGVGDAARGKEVFAKACAACHGEDGTGGEMAGAINNLAFLSLISDQALRRLVISGRPDLGMPDFANPEGRPPDFQPLTSAQIDDVVALLASWRRVDATNE